ncbi:ABC transporter substrate-binding protein [Acuticoccus sp. I52.16.1]|uniref:ABC transporter substrate-binding protein n=1 Tax=Acuticoccus sp. I52.16.1 TaxID=2928472 RepID=UPI001FD13831|nr:ABC transporter substrate-binding protein [Acuticoccus sp. I52.16.1]UOM32681.1 ABC transporter substrate-binding protein [Acuticoccus sp. I52.16.1]
MRPSFLRAAFFVAGLAVAAAAPAVPAAAEDMTDATGRSVAVPAAPQRIVVMHESLIGLPVMDLGLSVVGSYGRGSDGETLLAVDMIDAVLGGTDAPKPRGIGAIGAIDLEALRALRPDLVIGTERDRDKAEQLAKVAPVYLQAIAGAHGFGIEADLAAVLGREEAFAARRAEYAARIDAVRSVLDTDPAGKTYLAVIVHDEVNVVGALSGAVQALEDLGYTRAPLPGAKAGAGYGSMFAMPLSPEVFAALDPDLLVVMNSYALRDRSPEAIRASLGAIVPGWERFLAPAREGRLLMLDSARVSSPTVASALNTLDAYAAWAAK